MFGSSTTVYSKCCYLQIGKCLWNALNSSSLICTNALAQSIAFYQKFFWDWSESYSEPTQTSKHLVNYFCKNLHLRCLIEFWMSLCWRLKHLNKLYNYSVVSNLIILISVFDYIACIFSWCPYLIISYKLALSLS